MSYGNAKSFSQSGVHYLALLIQDNAVPVDECFCQFASIDTTTEDLESVKISQDAFLEVAAYLLGEFLDAPGMLHLFHEMDIDRDGFLGICDWRGALASADYWLSIEGKQASAAIRIQSVWRGHFERGALIMPASGMFSVESVFEPLENQKFWEDEDEEYFQDRIPATVIDDSLSAHDVLSALAALAHSKGYTTHSLFVYICKCSKFEPDKAFLLDEFIEAFANLCGDEMTDHLLGLLSQAFYQLMDLNGDLRVSSAEFFWVMRQYFEMQHSDTWNEDEPTHDTFKLGEKSRGAEQPAAIVHTSKSVSFTNDEVPRAKLAVELQVERNTSTNLSVNSAASVAEDVAQKNLESKKVVGAASANEADELQHLADAKKLAESAKKATEAALLQHAAEAAAAKQLAETAALKLAAQAAELKKTSEAAAAKQVSEAAALKLAAQAAELKKTSEAAAAKQVSEAAASKLAAEAAELKRLSQVAAAKQTAEAAAAKRTADNLAAKQSADAAALKQATEIAEAKRSAEVAAARQSAAEIRAKDTIVTTNASHLLATGKHMNSTTIPNENQSAPYLAPVAAVSASISSSRLKHAAFDPKTLVQNYGSSRADENIWDHNPSSVPSQLPRPSSSGGSDMPKTVHFSSNRPSTSDDSRMLRSDLNAQTLSRAAQSYQSRLPNSQQNIAMQYQADAFPMQQRAQNRTSSSAIDSLQQGSADMSHTQILPSNSEGLTVKKRVLLVDTENSCSWIRACFQKIGARCVFQFSALFRFASYCG
jgi:hypothetical protein